MPILARIPIFKALILDIIFIYCMEITVDQMYQIENKGHDMGFLKKFMMENAGAASVRRLVEKIENIESKNILIFVGLGNNGGDGLVMARHLAGYGAKVTVMLLGTPEKIKTEESNWNWSILKKMPSVKLMIGDSLSFDFKPDIIVDGILGTGISGEIREPYASAINYINKTDCYKFAVDVPSGLDPQTGETANICTKCNMTVTFHKMKQGIPKRKDLTGELYAEKIGIPPEAEEGIL
ncbi:NAD(P)H-hydrate epimerase [Nitrosopumilus adriaticus]|uniref:NAD(P)H-hydrate epimerase n=2 Tax=Nitrosopumilus adriaticus TaxID=1580092 RepID=A0A0D5C4G9_9ARCH|nr:NAD(P)H-hydrate epimerase [Nitrosopumilus adriaticus]